MKKISYLCTLNLFSALSLQAFSGEITQVGMWDRVLSVEEIQALAKCSSNIQVRVDFRGIRLLAVIA